jgi:Uma2 family endonuclease
MATEISKRLFTVDDYQRMAKAGILSEDDRVELVRGEVLAMAPINPPHNGAVLRASNALFSIVQNRAIVSVQGSIVLSEYDQPQPDICLLRRRDDFYTSQHATPHDILLIIEVADSSLNYDRIVKLAVYAQSGVPEYWIADISNDCVWVYSEIQEKSYSVTRKFNRGASLEPQLLPSCFIPVDVLLP